MSGVPSVLEPIALKNNMTTRTDFQPRIIVHGGAWAIPDILKEPSVNGVKKAAKRGYECLLKGGTAVDAVEVAVRILEDDTTFDAGHGSVLTEELTVEVDAMIMNGYSLESGAVASVTGIANPVSLARHIMHNTPHSLLVGDGAVKFAKKIGFPVLNNPLELISEESRLQLEGIKDFDGAVLTGFNTKESRSSTAINPGHDTVGAVAMDSSGRLACATSTGGISMKMPGRVGDSPLIGCGGYANKEGAVSSTGHGESIMKVLLAREVVYNIEGGHPPETACDKALQSMFQTAVFFSTGTPSPSVMKLIPLVAFVFLVLLATAPDESEGAIKLIFFVKIAKILKVKLKKGMWYAKCKVREVPDDIDCPDFAYGVGPTKRAANAAAGVYASIVGDRECILHIGHCDTHKYPPRGRGK